MKNILAISYWSFKEPVFQAAAFPYLKIMAGQLPKGSTIFFVTLEKKEFSVNESDAEQIKQTLKEFNLVHIKKKYHRFGLLACILMPFYIFHLTWLCLTRRVNFIHCFCMPAGGIGYLLSVLTRRQLIIDSYEPHAESMVENGTWRKNSWAFRILFWLEKMQTRRAGGVISLSAEMNKYAITKYHVEPKRYFTKSSGIDLSVFRPLPDEANKILRKKLNLENKIVGIYNGKLGGIYLDKEVFDFIKAAQEHWQDFFRMILISPLSLNEIYLKAKTSGVPDGTILSYSNLQQEELISYLSLSDFAIVPVKPVPTKRFCSPIKTGEYWAMGLPVIIPENIGDDSNIILENNIGAVLKKCNTKEYITAIQQIEYLLNLDKVHLREKIISIARKYRDINNTVPAYHSLYR